MAVFKNYTKTILFCCEPHYPQKIKKIAQSQGLTSSAFIRSAIDKQIAAVSRKT